MNTEDEYSMIDDVNTGRHRPNFAYKRNMKLPYSKDNKLYHLRLP